MGKRFHQQHASTRYEGERQTWGAAPSGWEGNQINTVTGLVKEDGARRSGQPWMVWTPAGPGPGLEMHNMIRHQSDATWFDRLQ